MNVVGVVVAVLLAVAAALTLLRILRGPSSLDRVVALDMLVAVAICGLAAYAAFTLDSSPVPAVAALTLIGFVGSVSVARFHVRDDE